MKSLLKVVAVIIIILLLMLGCIALVGFILGAPAHKGQASSHFDGIRFYNLYKAEKKTLLDVLKWQISRKKPVWPEYKNNKVYPLPRKRVVRSGVVSVTFINHATVLLQFDGLNILTDPIWSTRASPFSFAGPKRVRPPGLSMKNCPHIDAVLISHNHYDHLDLKTLLMIKKRFHPVFVTGLGNDILLRKSGIKNVISLDWWQSAKVGRDRLYFVPAQHFSGRGLFDRNKTLWGGFVIQSSSGPIYFAGDTAKGPHFSMIRKKFGPVFLALLPIGTYKPRNFMRSSHIEPKEAVDAFQTLAAQYAVGIHFDTFAHLADEPYGEAGVLVKKAMRHAGLPPSRFKILDFGASVLFKKNIPRKNL